MTKKGVTYCLLTIVMVVYTVFALICANHLAAEARCEGLSIKVEKNALSTFVSAEDIAKELGDLSERAGKMRASRVPMQQIEDKLNALSIIEKANCVRTANDSIRIVVVPMVPIARVFSPEGSYYINKDGKHLSASLRYQVDVPVVIVDKGSPYGAERIIPLLERITDNAEWDELVSAIKLDSGGNTILIPSIAGHVVNFGTPTDIDDKFGRLFTFYREVMPVKGWNYYDTISVKFSRQVIGSIAPGAKRVEMNQYRDEDLIEEISPESMSGDSINIADIRPKI